MKQPRVGDMVFLMASEHFGGGDIAAVITLLKENNRVSLCALFPGYNQQFANICYSNLKEKGCWRFRDECDNGDPLDPSEFSVKTEEPKEIKRHGPRKRKRG